MRLNLSDQQFTSIVLLVFLTITFAGIWQHEIWLDEAHHWLVAKDSVSLKALYYNMRYDGHPILWNILLFFVSRISHNPFSMQLLNLVLAFLSVFIFMKSSPFSRLHKVLFVFGYFMLYEYTIISRNYSLILLLSFICLALYPNRKNKYLALGLVITLLANTHLFGLIIAVGVTLVLFFDFILYQQKTMTALRNSLLGLFLIIFGVSLSILQIVPPEDTKLLHNFGLPSLGDAGRTISFFMKGFLPIPDISRYHFWNSSAIANFSRAAGGVLSFILFFIPLLVLRKKLFSILFFYSCAILLMAFFSVSGMAASRYFGVIYIAFILSYWLAHYEESTENNKLLKLLPAFSPKINHLLITTLLAIHVLISLPFYYFDLRYPFSEAKATVNYLRQEDLEKELIVVDDCLCTTLSAYLNKPLYYLRFDDFGSFCPWNNGAAIDEGDILRKIKLLTNSGNNNFIVIRSKKIAFSPDDQTAVFLKSFTQGMVESENYYIYRISIPGGIR